MLGWLGYGLAAPLKMTWLVLYFIPLASETTLHEMFLFHNAVLEDIITYLNKNMLLQVFAHVLFWAFWWRGRKTGRPRRPHRRHRIVIIPLCGRFNGSAPRRLEVYQCYLVTKMKGEYITEFMVIFRQAENDYRIHLSLFVYYLRANETTSQSVVHVI